MFNLSAGLRALKNKENFDFKAFIDKYDWLIDKKIAVGINPIAKIFISPNIIPGVQLTTVIKKANSWILICILNLFCAARHAIEG